MPYSKVAEMAINNRGFTNVVLAFISIISVLLINASYQGIELEDNDFDEMFNNISTTEQLLETRFQVPDEKWISEAIKDIAHYLRNYKFNEWDQRYYNLRPDDVFVGYYDTFPIPILRSLHWKVYEQCEKDFYKCISYLHHVIESVPFGRNDDIVTTLNKKSLYNKTLVQMLNFDCKKTKLNSEVSSMPFDSPNEKFQWRTTASYYMCWYTMLGTPALSMLGETCDNFANCLDPKFGRRNRDPRSDDKQSFACAMYSFCPDPCCPIKHVEDFHQCHEAIVNPCFEENRNNSILKKKCTLERKSNRNLSGIISNKWNVTCHCKNTGYVWKSQFGICVDINECLDEKNVCDNATEDCLNVPGSYKCVCKWGFELNHNRSKCVDSDIQIMFDGDMSAKKNKTNMGSILKIMLQYIGIII